jgi:hypothetical protein
MTFHFQTPFSMVFSALAFLKNLFSPSKVFSGIFLYGMRPNPYRLLKPPRNKLRCVFKTHSPKAKEQGRTDSSAIFYTPTHRPF